MVNSCSILTALLVVGTAVLAVPIVPEGTASAGMPEGMLPPPPLPLEGAVSHSGAPPEGVRVGTTPGGSQPGHGGIQVGRSERSLLIGAVDARGLSFAEGRSGPQQSRSFQRRHTEQAQEPAGLMAQIAFLKAYHPLHENYKRAVEELEEIFKKPRSMITDEEFYRAVVDGGTIATSCHIIKEYVQGNGNGISQDKLERIRAAFQSGEPWRNILDIM
ncbi:hypothetical protein F5051DRAFT_421981 [Lentinula edodes]|nr:hypothetical protein F5051DRAFT_421981 [Lentinula edodes]